MLSADHVAIVGGGFSGTLLAINLLRHGEARVTLIERRGDRLGRGLAYGAAGTTIYSTFARRK
ncbi:MAG: FAD-dependent oxidoreductase [Sphingobium sp.]